MFGQASNIFLWMWLVTIYNAANAQPAMVVWSIYAYHSGEFLGNNSYTSRQECYDAQKGLIQHIREQVSRLEKEKEDDIIFYHGPGYPNVLPQLYYDEIAKLDVRINNVFYKLQEMTLAECKQDPPL